MKNLKLSIRSGEILGIAGVGGNGQKELAEILSGVKSPTSGVIKINDKNLVGKDPSEFSKMGMGRIPEDRHEGVVGDLTVYENLALEHLDEYSKNGFLDKQAIRKNAEELIKNFQIKVEHFPVEICKKCYWQEFYPGNLKWLSLLNQQEDLM